MSDSCILIVEQDLLVRTRLAEYLRECGYLVLEASSAGDARTLLEDGSRRVDIVLAEVKSGEPGGRDHLSHLDRRQSLAADGLCRAARGQTGRAGASRAESVTGRGRRSTSDRAKARGSGLAKCPMLRGGGMKPPPSLVSRARQVRNSFKTRAMGRRQRFGTKWNPETCRGRRRVVIIVVKALRGADPPQPL